jgi:hypothetical protein
VRFPVVNRRALGIAMAPNKQSFPPPPRLGAKDALTEARAELERSAGIYQRLRANRSALLAAIGGDADLAIEEAGESLKSAEERLREIS